MGIWLLVGFRHLTEFFFEVSDLVAQTGRKFELELFGGGVHPTNKTVLACYDARNSKYKIFYERNPLENHD